MNIRVLYKHKFRLQYGNSVVSIWKIKKVIRASFFCHTGHRNVVIPDLVRYLTEKRQRSRIKCGMTEKGNDFRNSKGLK